MLLLPLDGRHTCPKELAKTHSVGMPLGRGLFSKYIIVASSSGNAHVVCSDEILVILVLVLLVVMLLAQVFLLLALLLPRGPSVMVVFVIGYLRERLEGRWEGERGGK